jgi:hypothetical protein
MSVRLQVQEEWGLACLDVVRAGKFHRPACVNSVVGSDGSHLENNTSCEQIGVT